MKFLFTLIIVSLLSSYASTFKHSLKNKLRQPPDDEQEDDKAYLARKAKKEKIFDINNNFTQGQIENALFEEGRANGKSSEQEPSEDSKPKESDPHIYLDMSEELLNKRLGKFRAYGEKINFHYPSDEDNPFQTEELEKRNREQAYLSDKLVDLKGFNASNYNYTIPTDALLSGRASQALKIKLQQEEEEYSGQLDSFANSHRERLKAKMIENMKKVIQRKKAHPDSNIEGVEYSQMAARNIIFSPYQKVNLLVKGVEQAERYMPKSYLVSPFESPEKKGN